MADRVDLETLLWEAREILRDLSKVSRAQSDEIERLGGCVWEGARELQERSDTAVACLAAALNGLQSGAYELGYNEHDDDGASATSSSFDGRRAAIDEWAALTSSFRDEFGAASEFPLGADTHLEHEQSHHIDNEDDDDFDDEYNVDGLGDTSFVSATSSFWRTDNFDWADEPSRDETDEDESEAPSFDTSRSMLNVPDLVDDSARFDTASESGESFASADMLAHSGGDSDEAETVCSDRDQQSAVLPKPTVRGDPSTPRVIRTRTVSFNLKMTDDDDDLDEDEEDVDTASSSVWPTRLMYNKAVPKRLRGLAHMGSLPNIGRLFTLHE